nr:MAG TPA: Gag protein, VIRAL PROTEIN, FOAMY VIRUS [Caudoviricetes sp.]DAY44283.1 MAG TPA: Gag protein, VIRAL PROTEIN, FOAMY VIRUS [Caudoviricetes sp.]
MIFLTHDPRDIPIAVPRNPAPVEGAGFRCKLL